VHAKTILSDVSFSLLPGEVVGLIGANGAGKSSLIKLLQQFNTPSRGDIHLLGKPLSAYNRREIAKLIAVVGQQHQGLEHSSVLDVVRLGQLPHKAWYQADNHADLQQLLQALAKVGLTALANQPFSELSGGEQQRVFIARALVQQPKLLLLDEPTNHLDVHYQHQVMALIRQLGVTVLTSIHDLNLAATYCDRILLLDNGRLVANGTPEQVLQQSLLSAVFQIPAWVDRHPFTGKIRVSYALPEQCQVNAFAVDTSMPAEMQ
jgi:iron complex transport system ATP-binding protein